MEQWEKENPELNIDDIMKEFGDSEPEQETVQGEKFIPEEDVTLWDGQPVQRDAVTPAMPQDTVRLNDITKVVKQKLAATEATIAFTPIGAEEEPEEPAFIPPEEPQTEPYSQEWEPEYEDPIGEYVPAEPIVFRPKSRLRELKKKLIAGPEKRYYQLMERGFGKLQLAILCCGIVAAVSVFTAGMYAAGFVPEGRMKLLVFGQILGMLLAALLGSYQLMEGFSDLVKRRFSLNTLLLFSFIACVADGILCLKQVRMPCCAPFSLSMTMSLWCAYQNRNTELKQMDTMRRAIRLDSVILEEDYHEGQPAVLRGEGQVEDFMEHYRTSANSQRTVNTYSLVVLFISIAIGITAGVMNNIVAGIRFFSASLLIGAPAMAHIAVSRPMAILERKLHKLGVVLCGWKKISALNTAVTVPLRDEDLFPAGTCKLNGVKFYGSRNPDQVVAYGTAVVVAHGGGLAPLFSQLLESRNGYHFEVEALRYYPNGGVGGVVNGEAVLVGTLSFMKEMDISIPEGNHLSQAVYVAVDGLLNGVFAITYQKTKATAMGLTTLCAYRGVKPMVIAEDFMLDEAFIAGKFGVNTRRMVFPDRKLRKKLNSHQPDSQAEVVALTTQEGLAGAACAVTGARAVHKATVVGVAVQMMGGILGLLIMLALTVIHAEHLLTPENLLIYMLVWMLPGWLISEWTRFV